MLHKNTEINTQKEKFIIIIMIISLFIGIYLALNSWLTMKNSDWITYQNEQRIVQTEKLATDSDRDYFIVRKILPLLRHICENKNLDIKSTRNNLLSKYDLDISIYKFSKKKLIETAPDKAENKWLMKNLFPALVEKKIENIEKKKKELDKKIEFAFGYGKNLYSLQSNPEKIINTVISGKESFAAWSSRNDIGVIILSNGSADKNKILNEVIKSTKFLPNQIFAGKLNENTLPRQASLTKNDSYDSTKSNQSFTLARSPLCQPTATTSSQGEALEPHRTSPNTHHTSHTTNHAEASASVNNPLSPSSLFPSSLPLQAYNYLSQFSKDYGVFDNKEWYFTKTKNNEKYYTVYNCDNSIYYSCLIYFRLFIIILSILSILIILKQSANSILNLKKFVILLFISSSILPLILSATTSLESIETITNIYRNELSSSIEEAIGNIVQNFGNYVNKASDELKILSTPSEEGFKDKDAIKKMGEKINERFPETRVTARDSASNVIYSNIVSFSEGQESLFKSLSNRYIEKYVPERLKESEYSGNQFTDVITRKDDLPFSVICNFPEQLQFIKNNDFSLFLFIKVYEAKYGNVALLEIQPNIKNLIKEYTKKINKRNLVAKQQIINLAAYNPLYFKWHVPPKKFIAPLFEQAKTAYVMNKPIFRKINHNNEEIYALCVPNTNYEDICYIGFLSTNIFKNKIVKIKHSVLLGAIIAIIILIYIISWLMKQIIAPLTNLEIGIKALSEHKYETKIPVPKGKDELVTLFKEFNFMMGENYDMQIAKNVQEGLITTKFPNIQGYYINGISLPLEDLAGDCLTSYTLPDGKILFLIGDLTGHGIGSALMMSFVRSITFNWSQIPRESPSSLVNSIDRMLRENQMGNMFMGIICGIMNPEDGKIIFITKGHIYPLFIRNDNSLEWLGTPSTPIGIGKKQIYKEQSTILLPGERLLCLTDGLLATNNFNAVITFQQIEIWAKECIDNDNSKWLKSIENKYLDWCSKNNAIPIDDITLFTIINEK